MMMILVQVKGYEWVLVGISFFLIVAHRLYDGVDLRIDIFLLIDYSDISKYDGRNISKIIYEISLHLTRLFPVIVLYLRINNDVFFIWLCYYFLEFLGYILFFGQGVNPYIFCIIVNLSLFLIFRRIWKKVKK